MTPAENSTNQLQKLLFGWRRRFLRHYPENGLEYEDDGESADLARFCDTGANLDILEQRGISCIPFVFWDQELIQFFLDKGRNVNAQDEEGRTALNLATHFGLTTVVEFLLSKGADPNICDNKGDNAFLSLAKSDSGQWEEVDGDGENEPAMPRIGKLLIDHGVDVNATSVNMETVLHCAFDNAGYVPNFSEFLVEKYTASVDARSAKYLYELTPLMKASESKSVDACKLLLAKGADINATDLNGWTALHHAATQKGSDEYVSALLDAGADPNIRCLSGRDVYEMSCLRGRLITPTDTEKKIRIYELFGALKIVKDADYEGGINWWKMALSELGQSKSDELQENYKLAKEWNPDSKEISDKLVNASLDTIVRLSQGASKLWNIMNCATACSINQEGRRLFQCILDYALSKLIPESAINILDLNTLFLLLRLQQISSNCRNEFTPHALWLLKLTLLCLEKIFSSTNSNIVLRLTVRNICTRACHLAMSLLSFPQDKVSAKERNECKHFLKTMIGLDPRDTEGNGILHTLCNSALLVHFGEMKEIDTLISFGANIGATNNSGYTPMQIIDWYDRAGARSVRKKLANWGAHIDARSSEKQGCLLDGIPINEWFSCVSLKCLSAKVLTTRHVDYRNAVLPCGWKLPTSVVKFIDSHVYSGWDPYDGNSSDDEDEEDEEAVDSDSWNSDSWNSDYDEENTEDESDEMDEEDESENESSDEWRDG